MTVLHLKKWICDCDMDVLEFSSGTYFLLYFLKESMLVGYVI